MSFSSDVKEELSRQISTARHCQIAEIAAILSVCGHISISPEDAYQVTVQTENISVARKYFTLLKKTFNIRLDVMVRQNKSIRGGRSFEVVSYGDLSAVRHVLIQNLCCKRAFIRGAFLASGSVSDPEKGYHFEIVCNSLEKANQLCDMIGSFGIEARVTMRKKNHIVYIKEGAQIVDMLNIMEAHVALMNFENIRILKEMRNSVNRQVNCETANLNKTVSAAVKQIEDIQYIKATIGFDQLPEGLTEIAELRLEQPQATLKELGQMLTPCVGKSGVNHRLRKLSLIAEELREHKEEKLL